MVFSYGGDYFRWVDPDLGERTLELPVPLQRKSYAVRQHRYANDSLDVGSHEVISTGNAVQELTGIIEYVADPQLLLEMLLFGAMGGELTYFDSSENSTFVGVLVEPTGDFIELIPHEDLNPGSGEYQIPVRLRGGAVEYTPLFPVEIVGEATNEQREFAITPTYTRAFTMGPESESDPSYGLLRRVWQARVDGNNVLLARENVSKNAFEAERVLFSYTGAPIEEVDVAFDKNAQVVVCGQRPTGVDGAPEVWLYYYDSTTQQYSFRNLGPGRTPRLLLDEPKRPVEADVILVYINDLIGVGGSVCYRQQRQRYDDELVGNRSGMENHYIEDVVMDQGRRLCVILSYSNPDRQMIEFPPRMETLLYPVVHEDLSTLGATAELQTLILKQTVFPGWADLAHMLDPRVGFEEVRVFQPIVTYYQSTDTDRVHPASADFLSIVVKPLIIVFYLGPESDQIMPARADLDTVRVKRVIVEHRQYTDNDYVYTVSELRSVVITSP